MKRILITGANSYIGTSFERYIKENYPDEYLIDTVDMIDGSWREKSFSGYDSVFHVAGIAHQKETKENAHLYYEVNRDLAIETAKKAKVDGVLQFVFLSSMSVYGMETGVITKDTLPNPKTYYGKSKREAEQGLSSLTSDDFRVCILRPPMVYGKGCKGNYQNLVKIAAKVPVFPDYRNQRSMISIENLTEYVRKVIDSVLEGTYMPQNAEYVCTSDMVAQIALEQGKRIRLTKVFNPLVWLLAKVSLKGRKAFGSLIYQDIAAFERCGLFE